MICLAEPVGGPGSSAAGTAGTAGNLEGALGVPNLQSVPAIDRLDVEDFLLCQTQNTPHRCGDVLVHAIGEFDHDDRSPPRSTHQATGDSPGALTKFAQDNLHDRYLSNPLRGVQPDKDFALTGYR